MRLCLIHYGSQANLYKSISKRSERKEETQTKEPLKREKEEENRILKKKKLVFFFLWRVAKAITRDRTTDICRAINNCNRR